MKKHRNYSVVMYAEPDTTQLSAVRWAYILHDRDIDDNGELKKGHWHLLLEFPNPRSISSVAKMMNVEENLVQVVYDVEGSRAYLTHKNAPSKVQYDVSEVKANYNLTEIDKPLSFKAIYNICRDSENFEDFISQFETYKLPQTLANYSLLVNIWKNNMV